MYSVKLLKAATRDLEKLDKSTVNRVVRRMRWLSENLDNIKPGPLKGELKGLYKIREGDYRINL